MVYPTGKDTKHIKDQIKGTVGYLEYIRKIRKRQGKPTWCWNEKDQSINSDSYNPLTSKILYLPTQEGISASCLFLQDKFTHEQLDAFCNLMNSVLTHNNFNFDGKYFKQVFGTSMGTKMAPIMACLFIGGSTLMESTSNKCLVPAWVPKWHPSWLASS